LSARAETDLALNSLVDQGGYTLVDVSFLEVITSDLPPFNGRVGYTSLSYRLNGVISEFGNVGSEAEVQVMVDRDGSDGRAPERSIQVHRSSTEDWFDAGVFSFIWGQPYALKFDLFLALGTVTFTGDSGLDGTLLTYLPPHVRNGTGLADFQNTLSIGPFYFFDELMNPVTGVTVSAESGTVYEVAQVPEPASVALVALGFVGLAVRRLGRGIRP
jgi:hypothetical protein